MRRHLPAVALVLALTPLTTASQPADADAARLRALFFQRDFESGIIDGRKLVAAAPERMELQAWYVLSLARGDRADEAIDVSQRMIAASPRSGWAWMARGAALHYKGGRTAEADEATKTAFELMPTSGDAAWLRAQTLAGDPAPRERSRSPTRTYARRQRREPAHGQGMAYVMSSAAMTRDEAKLKAAFDTYAEARQLDPANVNAHFLPGTYLSSLKRGEEAYDLLKKAVALAPGARDVHRAYWTAVKAHPTLTAEQKNADIEGDLTAFLSRHGNRPGALLTASYGFQDLKQPDRQRQVEDTIVQKFNDSPEAEWVLITRLREFNSEEGSKKPERRLLREYVARPKHYHEGPRRDLSQPVLQSRWRRVGRLGRAAARRTA
jgi:tetratricopeptide (TPR) repeat protein